MAVVAAALGVAAPKVLGSEPLDPARIGDAAGVEATQSEDGVVRIEWARTDVAVHVDGVRLAPFAGLGSWAAFTITPTGTMVMGDTVVFEDEVDAAMDTAFARGLEVTALHNHFFFDEPKVYFMHLGGHGAPAELAAAVGAVWEAIKKVRAVSPEPRRRFPGAPPAGRGAVGQATVTEPIGHAAVVKDGVVKITIGRRGTMMATGVGSSMGLATWIAFSGSDELAVADGDVIMTAPEVQVVLRALRRGGFHVVALHNHMLAEDPPFLFVHFWGKGPAKAIATAFRSVLDAQSAVTR